MKILIRTLVAILIMINVGLFAQTISGPNSSNPPEEEKYIPEGLNYQAIARDADGSIISDTRIGIRIEILKGTVGDELEYVEYHHVRTNFNGQFSLVIGHGNKEMGSFKAIKWEEGNKWLQFSVDINETGQFEFMGKSQMLSVPYAMYAGSAGGVKGSGLRNGNADDWDDGIISGDIYNNNSGNVGVGTNNPKYQLHVKGNSAFPMNVEGNSGSSKFMAFSQGNTKLGWLGTTSSGVFKIKNASNSYMTFETKGAFNMVVNNDASYPDMRAINLSFNNGWRDGTVRFYNERVYQNSSANPKVYDPSQDKVRVGVALHRTEYASERLDVRGGIKLSEAFYR